MTFDEVLDQVRELLHQRGRVTYRSLKRRFDLDDEYLEDLKGELIRAEGVAADEDGDVLVWTGSTTVVSSQLSVPGSSQPPAPQTPDAQPQPIAARRPPLDASGERRQLTVQFIDLVGSTTLSQQLDPEDYHTRVVAYQGACRQVIARYEGHIAQYLGDGVLVYFGYPAAHDEDAVRAVRSGLQIVTVVSQLAYTPPLQVRIGIHTGPVVVGEIGAGERTERLALGETPNIAARLQGLAAPDTVVISGATQHLVQGLFECQNRGPQELKGISTPLPLYRVVGESAAQSRFEVAVTTGLTPLVGREEEMGLLLQRWERVKEGQGQVVLLSGEAGIGKSRLVQVLKERLAGEPQARLEWRCSPFYQNSALYPVIEYLQRLLQWRREDAPEEKLKKLEGALVPYGFSLQEMVPLVAPLLSLPLPERYPPLALTPQRQKQKTLEALLTWLLKEAERQAVHLDIEDLHWADPSTLEFLSLLLDQVPTTRLLVVLTFRPEFMPPWPVRSRVTQITLSRLARKQAEVMVEGVTGGKALPAEVVQQVVSKTDGVPLFIEELTKTVVESGLVRATNGHYELTGPLPPLAIPATLQDSLMARLDRLGAVKEVAQLGATLGREFSYELLHAVSPLDEGTLQQGVKQLVEAELVYQRGLVPQAHYLFKHALIQDTSYQSLLKSTRQQYHRQIAQVLAERFPETVETQPELVAHHYTEAGLIGQALPYWQQAGQRASQRSAYVEAIAHLSKGLEVLNTLPETPARAQQELTLQIALGAPLTATKGLASPEIGQTYNRARVLCQQIGETPDLVRVLWGLTLYYVMRLELQTALELGEQCLRLAQRAQDAELLLQAHHALWPVMLWRGDFPAAHHHLERGMALYDTARHHAYIVFHGGHDPGACCLQFAAINLWILGYPNQAFAQSRHLLTLTQTLAHPFSQALAHNFTAIFHELRRDSDATKEHAEAAMRLCAEQGIPFWEAWAAILRGRALTALGQHEEGTVQMRQGLAAFRATGALAQADFLAWLAEGYGMMGQPAEGLTLLAEALAHVQNTGERWYDAELYRLKGELSLQSRQVKTSQDKSEVQESSESGVRSLESEAEECFLKAIEIARRQQAKSWELRASTSLARLWQKQAKKAEAQQLLAEIYGWFTEGFDTRDLQEAKALLDELS